MDSVPGQSEKPLKRRDRVQDYGANATRPPAPAAPKPTALAEFERDLIGERTKAGLQAARARGRRGGRKRALTQKQIALAKSMKADPHNSIADICATLRISKRTLYRYTGEHHAETKRL